MGQVQSGAYEDWIVCTKRHSLSNVNRCPRSILDRYSIDISVNNRSTDDQFSIDAYHLVDTDRIDGGPIEMSIEGISIDTRPTVDAFNTHDPENVKPPAILVLRHIN